MRDRRLMARLGMTCVALLSACWLPTDACGCTPALASIGVRGTVVDADGRPVAGARLYFDGVPAPLADTPPIWGLSPVVPTDSLGRFRGMASSGHSGTIALRAAIVLAGARDTIRLPSTTAVFRYQGSATDTVRVDFRLP